MALFSFIAFAGPVWMQTGTVHAGPSHPPVVVGAIYPLGTGGQPARDEYRGLRLALRFSNRAGGIHGRHIQVRLAKVRGGDEAPTAVRTLRREGAVAIAGSESSLVALPASRAANAERLFYLETGAVATMETQRGLPFVFRTVTTAQTLGRSAAKFAARTIGPKLHLTVHNLRVAVVYVDDVYGRSVAAAQIAESRRLGVRLVRVLHYSYPGADFHRLVRRLAAARPNVVLVAAYRPDAIAFRRETIRQRLRVGAMIGTSSSFCMMGFARALGKGAVGLFAADKPDGTVNRRALLPAANRLRAHASLAYRSRYGSAMSPPAVAGFVGGWVLFHEILPRVRHLSAQALRRAALRLALPEGSEINGAGVRFAGPRAPDAGQNLRAVSVVWQWQRPDHAVIVSPRAYATGRPRFIPLPPSR